MATDTKSELSAGKPPYIPYETLAGFIGRLKETTVPTAIDKSMMGNIAGGLQSYLLAAMRFLGLTEGKSNDVTPELEKLVEAHGTEGYKPALAEIVKAAYAETIGSVDLTKATAKQLDDAFGKHDLDGVVRDRAIRFYLKALADADIRVSPLLGARKAKGAGSTSNGKVRKAKAKPSDKPSGDTAKPSAAEQHHDAVPEDLIQFPIPIGTSKACIRVPRNITPKDIPLVRAIFSAVEALAKQNSGEE